MGKDTRQMVPFVIFTSSSSACVVYMLAAAILAVSSMVNPWCDRGLKKNLSESDEDYPRHEWT